MTTNQEQAVLLEQIETHPFLRGMRPEHVALLTDCAMATSFAPNELIFRQGEFANRFYLIENGEVVLEALDSRGRQMVIERAGPGKLVGWSWLFPPYIWHFDARATQPTGAFFFYGTILREHCERDPSLGYELLKRMSTIMVDRLQNARAQLLAGYATRTRLIGRRA
jgi:CRP-like cAMP-binding protein